MKNFLLKRVVPERLTKTWWVNSLSKKFVLRSLNKNMVILLENGTEKFISILLQKSSSSIKTGIGVYWCANFVVKEPLYPKAKVSFEEVLTNVLYPPDEMSTTFDNVGCFVMGTLVFFSNPNGHKNSSKNIEITVNINAHRMKIATFYSNYFVKFNSF